MNSLHPVVNLGSFYWNPELLPRDELAGRLRAARALMKQHGWNGLLVFGDCAEPGALAWLTNVCPRMRWTAALVTAQGEPILVVPGAVRDFPMTAVMTPYTDIRSWGNVVKILTEWVQGLGVGAKVAVYGFPRMAPSQRSAVDKGLAAAGVQAIGPEIDALMTDTKPREGHLVRQGSAVLKKTTDAFRAALAKGRTPGEAALDAERTARLAGAHDVRILLSRDKGRSLEPFFATDFPKDGACLAWFGVRYLGYWTEGIVTLDGPPSLQGPVQAALKEAVTEAKAGASRAALTRALSAQLSGLDPHEVFGTAAVKRLGLSLDDEVLGQAEEDRLLPGAIYSIRVAASGSDGAAAASALVRAGDKAEVLWISN